MEKKIEVVITVTPKWRELYTYTGVAQAIADIQHPVGSQAWIEDAEAKIKRFGHAEKLSVYQRIKMFFADKRMDAAADYLNDKIAVHNDFAIRPDDMMIHGRGRWK